MVENGIKPCYVFDGKPPEMKAGVVRESFYLSNFPSIHSLPSSRNGLNAGKKLKRKERRQKKPVSNRISACMTRLITFTQVLLRTLIVLQGGQSRSPRNIMKSVDGY